ncbi:MAG: hypothetical protein GXO39_06925 [Thermotogae bacterium]|nr:hypothetical protein [Thermotogota bacterium]
MPATVSFFRKLENAFKRQDLDEIVALGVRMIHMGWYSRLDWFMDRLIALYSTLPPEKRKKLNEERIINLFYVAMYVLRDMEPDKALPYIRGKESLIEKRIFHEYLGNNPMAYRYLLKFAKTSPPNFWVDIRKLYFRIYKGSKINPKDLENLQTSEDELEFVAQVIMKGYVLALYHLLYEEISEKVFEDIKRILLYGLSENYDHTTARLLQVFVPLAFSLGKETLARKLTQAAISTAETEKNRYMYEWFNLYSMALERKNGLLKDKIVLYRSKGYIGHEVLALTVLRALEGENPELNGRLKHLIDRYWHRHTFKMANILSGGKHL